MEENKQGEGQQTEKQPDIRPIRCNDWLCGLWNVLKSLLCIWFVVLPALGISVFAFMLVAAILGLPVWVALILIIYI